MFDEEASSIAGVSEIVDESEIKSESADGWWLMPIKQEPDLDAADTDNCSASNVASSVAFSVLIYTYAYCTLGYYWHQRADERHGNPPPR